MRVCYCCKKVNTGFYFDRKNWRFGSNWYQKESGDETWIYF